MNGEEGGKFLVAPELSLRKTRTGWMFLKFSFFSYLGYMNTIVSGNLQKAKRGGIPGTFPLVRSFVEVRVSKSMIGLEDGRFQGQPVWPLIYYCLRCGDVSAAMEVARGAE